VSEATWLPNLVGGTSIWKLAVDLNEKKFFDGRLLVPETEGSESLPVTVRWDLTGLIPLSEAHAKHPEDAGAAVKDFQDCLARVAKVFSTPNSGFDKYKEAFTVPALDADNGANYFYSPLLKKLFVINWGASPRSMGGKAEYVFGYEDWGKHWGDPASVVPAAAVAAGAGVAAGAAVAAAAGAKKVEEKKDEKKEEEKKKDDDKARPWWMWPLFGLIVIGLILLALFLLKTCEEQRLADSADASDALVEGAANSDGSVEGGLDGAAAAGDGGDAGADAAGAGDGGDAGADAASADGGDAGKDGGLAWEDEDDDDDNPTTSSSGGVLKLSSGGTSSSGGASSGSVVVKIGPGPNGGQKTSLHRKHFSDDAVKWRVASGAQKVSRTEQQPGGKQYDVWLAPGNTFEGVKVEWKDKAGKWHVH
jgi:hypothetical protein